MEKQTKSHSIFWRVLFPLLVVVFMQIGLFAAAINSTGVMTRVQDYAVEALQEKTASRRDYLANEMVGRWSNLSDEEKEISTEIAAMLGQSGRTAQDMQTDWRFNATMLETLAPRLIEMLRLKQTTGLFCVLNGAGVDGDTTSYASFYIRDTDPTNSASSNSDLMVVRGMPALARSLNISLSSFWRSCSSFPDEQAEAAAYFFKPVHAAQQSTATASRYFGYWSDSFYLGDASDDYKIVTYTVPLIGPNGEVYGVLGVELSIDYLTRLMAYDEITPEKRGVYLLGKSRDGGQTYTVVCESGPSYQSYFGAQQTLSLNASGHGELCEISAPGGTSGLLASEQTIRVYDRNTPFESEQWALVSVVPQNILFSFSNQFASVLLFCFVVVICMGICVAAVASRAITNPISRLVEELRGIDPNKKTRLTRINIQEIDELSGSIETLSDAVAESSSRISQIITMAHVPLGVFEYTRSTDAAFCSESLFEVMGWPGYDPDHAILNGEEMERLFSTLQDKIYDNEAHVYQFRRPGEKRDAWVQVNIQNEPDKVLGVVLDVTQDIIQKRKIEYERDYDTLTSTLNRRAFRRMLEELFSEPREKLQTAALLMFDLDNLKYLNDKYGHDCGDRYIQAFSNKLRLFEQYGAVVARRSGDEFYVLFYGFEDKEHIRAILRKIWPEIKASELLLPDGDMYKIRASGGLTWYPDDATEFADLITYADFAMYSVKHSIKGDLAEFNRAEYNSDAILINGAEALNRLVDGGLVRYALQPVVDLQGEIYGYEMLMRPQIREFSTPMEVLRIARAQSQMHHIERLTWEKSMRTFGELRESGRVSPQARVFINSTSSHTLTPAVRTAIERAYPELLGLVVLEITEEEQQNEDNFHTKLEMIRSWHGQIAIDDFGTGYNSELSLITYSPDIVKIDISLVRDVDKDPGRQRLIEGLLDYAHARNIRVLAEGVETEREMRELVTLGVDLLQGFYVAHPSFDPEPIDQSVVGAIRWAANRSSREQPK